jgi:D-alanine-D-alanine ligase
MKIGLTYDLRSEYLSMGFSEEETAEFDRDDTVTAIETALQKLGHDTDRIGHARSLIARLAAGDRWDLVFNICEGMYGIAREAQVPAILDIYGIAYTFSDPLVTALTLHKAMTKRMVRDHGFPTPEFALVHTIADLDTINFDPPYFIKPVAEGTSKGITPDSIIMEKETLTRAGLKMLAQFQQPVLVEKFLSGREFTVGVVGTGQKARVLGTMEVHLLANAEKNVYSYLNKDKCEELVSYEVVSADHDAVVRSTEDITLGIWRALECRDAGRVDVRCDDFGKPYFLEVNPLAGLHPEHSDLPILCTGLKISYLDLIDMIVSSACERIVQTKKAGKERVRG